MTPGALAILKRFARLSIGGGWTWRGCLEDGPREAPSSGEAAHSEAAKDADADVRAALRGVCAVRGASQHVVGTPRLGPARGSAARPPADA